METLHLLSISHPLARTHIIMNASRPLSGDHTWQGDFLCGTHYAAVKKGKSKSSQEALSHNESLNAKILKYYTTEEARETLLKHYRAKFAGQRILTDMEQKIRTYDFKRLQSAFHNTDIKSQEVT